MTHIDVYDEIKDIKVCVAYEVDGKEIMNFPSSRDLLKRAKPILKSFEGWIENISNVKEYSDLPVKAQDYIKFIEDYTNTPVGIISVGYQRKQTMMRTSLWTK